MKKEFSLRSLYLYAASFTALLFFLFGAVSSVTNLVALWQGESYYQTYTQFRTMYAKEDGGQSLKEDTEELKLAYQEEVSQYEMMERKRTVKNLSGSLTALILGVFFWQLFWKQTKSDD